MVFSFEFVYVVDNIDGRPYIDPSLRPWDKAYLIMVNNHFDVFLDLVGKNFIEYFWVDIHKGYWPVVFHLCWIFVWF